MTPKCDNSRCYADHRRISPGDAAIIRGINPRYKNKGSNLKGMVAVIFQARCLKRALEDNARKARVRLFGAGRGVGGGC